MIFQYFFIMCFPSPPISLLEMGNNSFRLEMKFKISNVVISVKCEETLTNSTYSLIQKEINNLVSYSHHCGHKISFLSKLKFQWVFFSINKQCSHLYNLFNELFYYFRWMQSWVIHRRHSLPSHGQTSRM